MAIKALITVAVLAVAAYIIVSEIMKIKAEIKKFRSRGGDDLGGDGSDEQ